MRALYLGLLIVFAFCGPATAWGELGHKIVCEIAYRLAAPDARTEIQRLIGTGSGFNTFSDACIGPDNPRTRDTEHYVNLPRDATTIASLNCPFEICVVEAVDADRKILSNKSNSDAQRLEALKYLGHWVGDIHQPLHVSLRGDSGGNAIDVFGQCSSDMHSTWDTCLVLKTVGGDFGPAATALIASVTPAMQSSGHKVERLFGPMSRSPSRGPLRPNTAFSRAPFATNPQATCMWMRTT